MAVPAETARKLKELARREGVTMFMLVDALTGRREAAFVAGAAITGLIVAYSLKTLFDEPDFTLASFLLSVLGEGTFLNLLWFLKRYAPEPLTQQVARLGLHRLRSRG